MRIDEDLIQSKIDIIEQNLKLLREIAKQDYKTFKKNYRDLQASKHSLQESIESCLDIANHIISIKGYRRAEDYKDIFKVLEENKIISRNLFERLRDMAKFRNLLVHRYEEIESKRIYRIINKDLDDIKEYLRVILKLLKKE